MIPADSNVAHLVLIFGLILKLLQLSQYLLGFFLTTGKDVTFHFLSHHLLTTNWPQGLSKGKKKCTSLRLFLYSWLIKPTLRTLELLAGPGACEPPVHPFVHLEAREDLQWKEECVRSDMSISSVSRRWQAEFRDPGQSVSAKKFIQGFQLCLKKKIRPEVVKKKCLYVKKC